MTRLRMAVIGVGHLGQHHARILAGMPDVDLVGVVDSSIDQARLIAERLDTRPYTSHESLLNSVDAVSIVTPTVHHHPVASAFLKAGVPVLVEKPICPTLAEADELIRLAANAGVPLQVGHIERFNPAFEELIRRPIRPKFVEAERHGPFTGRSIDIGAVLDTRPYTSHESLLNSVDAVSIVTPTVHHHPVASAFLKAGVPVLVEKPICPTLAEADELIRLAAKANVPLQVGHIERFNPAFEELIRRPIRPKFVEAERHGPFTGRSIDIGAVLDLMIHDIDLLLALDGTAVKTVEAVGATAFGGHEDMVNARLVFESGCIAHVTASRITQRPKRRLRIWAPEGYAGIDFVTRKLVLVQQSPEVRQYGLRAERMDANARAKLKDEVFGRHLQVRYVDGDRKGDQLTNELRHFIDCVRTGRTPRVTGEDGREALAVAERILASLRCHEWEGRADGPVGPNRMPRPAGWLFEIPKAEAA